MKALSPFLNRWCSAFLFSVFGHHPQFLESAMHSVCGGGGGGGEAAGSFKVILG